MKLHPYETNHTSTVLKVIPWFCLVVYVFQMCICIVWSQASADTCGVEGRRAGGWNEASRGPVEYQFPDRSPQHNEYLCGGGPALPMRPYLTLDPPRKGKHVCMVWYGMLHVSYIHYYLSNRVLTCTIDNVTQSDRNGGIDEELIMYSVRFFTTRCENQHSSPIGDRMESRAGMHYSRTYTYLYFVSGARIVINRWEKQHSSLTGDRMKSFTDMFHSRSCTYLYLEPCRYVMTLLLCLHYEYLVYDFYLYKSMISVESDEIAYYTEPYTYLDDVCGRYRTID